ncbi:hypothetical protein ACSFE6_22475 [Pseudomonas baetica]|uniref:hypothetical protein n=1 Tax=Pseudomonas baetica TaxID=674054 RepID=UPI003EEC4AE7
MKIGLMFFFLMASFGFARADSINYSNASEISSGRSGESLIRYIKTFGSECLAVEILSLKGGLKILESKNLCSFDGKKFSTDFAYAGFQNITFEKDGIHLVLNIIPLQPTGEQLRKCSIPITNGKMGDLQCSDAIDQE